MSVMDTDRRRSFKLLAVLCLFCLTLTSCYKPPYNDFEKDPPNLKASGAGFGIGAIVGSLLGQTLIGMAIGGTAGTVVSIYKNNKQSVIADIQKQDMQYIQYGDTMTLIIPTDHYYQFDSPKFNDICYAGLKNIIRLLRFYPKSHIYIAAFTDDVGDIKHKQMLTRARANTMLTFLWAHNIKASMLTAKGFADKFPVGDNHLIRGSAFNRRIELQWTNVEKTPRFKPTTLPKGYIK